MPNDKNKKSKSKAVDLPDAEAIKRLFPKKVLEQVRVVIEQSEKKGHK